MNLEEALARLAQIDEELEELAADDELSEDDALRYDALLEEGDELGETIRAEQAKQEKRDAIKRALEEGKATRESGSMPPVVDRSKDPYDLSDVRMFDLDNGRGFVQEVQARAVSAIEDTPDDHFTDEHRAEAIRKVKLPTNDGAIARHVLATGSDDYKEAWLKLVTGRNYLLLPDEQRALQRAMSLTDASGGFAVPFPIDPTLIQLGDGSSDPFRGISRVVTITTDSWQGLASTEMTASWDSEASEVSDDTTTFSQPSVTPHKAAAFVPASIEIAGDYPGLAGDLGILFADAKDRLEATAHATGSGSGQPFGIVTAIDGTGNDISTASTDTYAVADVYTTHETLGPRYRDSASWVMNVAIINDTRQFGTANNFHAFTVDLAAGQPRSLLGRPVYESSAMDGSVTALAENNIVVFGDFRNYLLVDRVGFTLEYIPHLFATGNNRPSGQRGWYAYWRHGADSINDDAFVLLNAT